jgi:hypothetical protein
VRRVRERLAGAGLQCIGTSATMKSVGTQEERARVVAGVASTLFAAEVTPQDVVREHVERVTDELRTAETERAKLGPALDAGLPEALTDAALFDPPPRHLGRDAPGHHPRRVGPLAPRAAPHAL